MHGAGGTICCILRPQSNAQGVAHLPRVQNIRRSRRTTITGILDTPYRSSSRRFPSHSVRGIAVITGGRTLSGSPRIAVIDDEDAFLALMRTVLDEEGYRVVVGRVPDDALTLIRASHPALVILDPHFRMSATRGMAILEEMRDDGALAAIPVLVCSVATEHLQQHHDAFAALAARTLRKPFDLTEFLPLVVAMLAPPVPAVSR